MLIKNLSGFTGTPVYFVEFCGVRLLLDCPLDFGPLLKSLPLHPLLLKNASPDILNPKQTWATIDNEQLPVKTIEGEEFLKSPPCVTLPFSVKHCPIIWSSIDAILVSNYQTIMGIPYVIGRTDFNGKIFATEPSIQYGRQILEDIANSVAQLPQCPSLSELIEKLRSLGRDAEAAAAENWLPAFTLDEIDAAFSTACLVSLNERVRLFNQLTVTPVSSGFCIGACNWLIESDFQRLAYLSASSQWSCHPLPIDWQPLVDCDAVLFNAVSFLPGHTPDRSVEEICAVVVATLAQGGNVLFPCHPCGVLYDLIETVSKCLDAKSMQRYPMYLISSRAKNSLSYCDIFGEWLSTSLQKRLYTADAPFCHQELLELKRLSHFPCLAGDFSRQLSQPCVAFCSDPSLRIGDCVHLLRAWAGNRQNSLIVTDPHFALRQAVAPFQPLEMQVYFYVMDMRMQPSQAAELLSLLRCRRLVLPDSYRSLDCHTSCASVQFLQQLGALRLELGERRELLEISPALAKTVRPIRVGERQAAMLDGVVSMGCHGRRRLQPLPDTSASGLLDLRASRPLVVGTFGPEDLVVQLRHRDFPDAKYELADDGSWSIFLECGSQEAIITGHGDSTHILCDDEKMRLVVRDSLLACLSVL